MQGKRLTIERSAEAQAFIDSFVKGDIFGEEVFEKEKLPACLAREAHTQLCTQSMDGKELQFANPLQETMYGESHVYTFTPQNYERIVIFIHGGGYVFNANSDYAATADLYSTALKAKVYMPMYALAPQGTWEECYQLVGRVYADAIEEGKPVLFMGHSAGGGIALGFAEALIEAGQPLPEKLVLFSPWIDVELNNPKISEHAQRDLFLARHGLARAGKFWASSLDTSDWRVSPKNYAHLEKLPPMFISVGTDEIFYPDITEFFDAAVTAGNGGTLLTGKGLFHEFPMFAAFPEGHDSCELVADFILG